MTDRRQRCDSIEGQKQAMQNALAGPIEPPKHVRLRDSDRPFWDAIIGARARDKWDAADLAHAANLARCQADIEDMQTRLEAEGHVIENARGTMVANPRHSILETLSRRAVYLSKLLHVHPEAKQGEAKDQGKALNAQRKAGQVSQDADDDLMPGLSTH
jgi:phage terminase small subunit